MAEFFEYEVEGKKRKVDAVRLLLDWQNSCDAKVQSGLLKLMDNSRLGDLIPPKENETEEETIARNSANDLTLKFNDQIIKGQLSAIDALKGLFRKILDIPPYEFRDGVDFGMTDTKLEELIARWWVEMATEKKNTELEPSSPQFTKLPRRSKKKKS